MISWNKKYPLFGAGDVAQFRRPLLTQSLEYNFSNMKSKQNSNKQNSQDSPCNFIVSIFF